MYPIELMFYGGFLLYLILLPFAFSEAERRHGGEAPAWPATHGLMIGANILLAIVAGCIVVGAADTGAVCALGAVLISMAPTVAFFTAILVKSARAKSTWVRILWRSGVYLGVIALMVGLGAGACSIQPWQM